MAKRAAQRLNSALTFLVVSIALADPASAATEPGNTAFLMVSTALVLLMTVPGLALFYCGMVRAKNALTTLLHVFATVCLVCVLWLLYGYSLAFTNGGEYNSLVGGLSKAFLSGVTPSSEVATFSNGVMVPELAYVCFQMTFAAITPALIVGAFAERLRFGVLLAFMALWLTFVYVPVAHMVWYWAGPDAIAAAAAALRDAAEFDKPAAQAVLDATLADAGLAFRWGAIDFAGGTVVHVNSGIAGLVAALMLGPRYGYRRDPMPPHSLPLCLVGACLLWVGWFGFNCGSNLEANGTAALAMLNTFGAAATAGLAWMFAEWIARGRPTLLGMVAGPVCFFFCTKVRNVFDYDDSLDVFGVHCVAGIVGALATGVLVNPALGGTGILDYVSRPGEAVVAAYNFSEQMIAQSKAVGLTLVWSAIGTAIILIVIRMFTPLRTSLETEVAGLDIAEHGESAYN